MVDVAYDIKMKLITNSLNSNCDHFQINIILIVWLNMWNIFMCYYNN